MYTAREQKLEAALILCLRMIDEALPLFNWGASALDANAFALLNEVPIAVRRALAEKIQIDVALSPEAVARKDIVALPIYTLKDSDDAYGVNDVDYIPRKNVLAIIDRTLTTLAAENAALRAENEELDFLRHEGGPDSVAAMEIELATLRAERDAWTKIDVARDVDFATLRASEAAAQGRITELEALLAASTHSPRLPE